MHPRNRFRSRRDGARAVDVRNLHAAAVDNRSVLQFFVNNTVVRQGDVALRVNNALDVLVQPIPREIWADKKFILPGLNSRADTAVGVPRLATTPT
jgi:hypothetical protein